MKAASEDTIWNLHSVFPGANLGNIKELRFDIVPSDFRGFWACLSTSLRDFFAKNLLSRELPTVMAIRLHDMEESFHLRNENHGVPPDRREKARFEDYRSALEPFRVLEDKLERCTISLPYWPEFAEGMPELRKYLQEAMNGTLIFEPMDVGLRYCFDVMGRTAPLSIGSEGFPERPQVLAILTEEEKQRVRQGMVEKLASTGHWT